LSSMAPSFSKASPSQYENTGKSNTPARGMRRCSAHTHPATRRAMTAQPPLAARFRETTATAVPAPDEPCAAQSRCTPFLACSCTLVPPARARGLTHANHTVADPDCGGTRARARGLTRASRTGSDLDCGGTRARARKLTLAIHPGSDPDCGGTRARARRHTLTSHTVVRS
jgi:hypothetical protein